MGTAQTQMEWPEIKGKIKKKWGKLVDGDIESFKDNMQLISAKIQSAYGYTKDKAEQEYAEFKKALESNVVPLEKVKQN